MRAMFRQLSAAAVPLIAAVTIGCGGGPPAPGRVYVVDRPPPARVEIAGARPGPEWAWIPGRYRWEGNSYAWEAGRWDRAPDGRRGWQPGHWAHSRHGYVWIEGRWR